ncbi:uncharacterized protein HMPREF1541_07803 [Cyphellophora europaea CBS 101466]|uniref:Ketoreductase (KR) domain-containing protein n=1 Tax=Cyphellophora europaea (strain CBS 101466) TaxID=1220924 RepID=W2RK16_CYPE1|nr:uncharacterized protein HMPREF1541_07803 [Cyphellophora europaea CBS 101466]ETN36816.1 hypothetical protein HMPREF1541_07803 [Cyphellophora europaea CBS 101466]
MVSLKQDRASNDRIKTDLPKGLVAVFAGGTNGVGETTVRHFANLATAPRVYPVERSQEAGARIAAQCKTLNPEDTFKFIESDTSLMRNVDPPCRETASQEREINLLFLSIETLQYGTRTDEGLNYPTTLTLYARSRFISNFVPLIRSAKSLRWVVSVYGATFEGRVLVDKFQG